MTDQIATSAPLVADTAPLGLDTPRIYVACLPLTIMAACMGAG